MLELIILGLPIALLQTIWKATADHFTSQPWQVIWILVPLGIVAIIAARSSFGRKEWLLDRKLLTFLSVYVVMFSCAAYSDLLVWNRKVTLFGQPVDRNWLAPAWTGDWRYKIVPRKPLDPDDLVVVTRSFSKERSVLDARRQLANLIKWAEENGAKGIAFDVFFRQISGFDSVLCETVRKSKLDIVVGIEIVEEGRRHFPGSMPNDLDDCFTANQRGHLVGLRDADGVVRLMPLFFDDENLEALSLRVAKIRGKTLELPDDKRLRFIAPAGSLAADKQGAIPVVTYQELEANPSSRSLLKNAFLMFGEDSPGDIFVTPFGNKPGVVAHAYAVHSLRTGHYFRRTSWWSALAVIAVACYLVALWAARGIPAKQFLFRVACISVLVILTSAVSAMLWLVWLEVVYVLAAIWFLAIVLLVCRVCVGKRLIPNSTRRSIDQSHD